MKRAKTLWVGVLALAIFMMPGIATAAIDPEAIVQGKCTACHSPERIRTAAKTKEEWEKLIDEEIDRGAQLTRAERRAVIDWLTTNYSSQTEPARQTAQQTTPVQTEPQTPAPQTPAQQSLPFNKQADTGVELWQFVVTGGALLGGGTFLRRRK